MEYVLRTVLLQFAQLVIVNIVRNQSSAVHGSLLLDYERRDTPFSPAMLKMIHRARQEKVKNMTRQKERERRGEVLPHTILRRNQGPPPHVLVRMTKQQKVEDKIVRSISDVGYVAKLKRKKGHRLVDDKTWRKEEGLEAQRDWLVRSSQRLKTENARRRKQTEEIQLTDS